MNWTHEQRRILAHPLDWHAVVRSAPGSGKTTTLVGRVRALLERGVEAARIRVVMFNRAIQQTFQDRLREQGVEDVRATTFDALGLAVLREADRQRLLSRPLQVVPEGTAQWARQIYLPFRHHIDSPREIANAVAFWKAQLVPPGRAAFPANPALVDAYRAAELLRLQGDTLRVAFEDMVYTAVGVLGQHPRLLGRIDQFLVDEFQDVNPGRVALLHGLMHPGTALMAVGDEDQGINEWCGAHPRYFSDFAATFPNLPVTEYPLAQSFRFGPILARAASALIGHNEERAPGRIRGGGPTVGEIHRTGDVLEALSSLLNEGWRPADIAVLYRGRPQGAPVLASLAAAGVPLLTEDLGVLQRGRGPELALGYLRCATTTGPLPPDLVWPVLCAPDRFIKKDLMFDLLAGQGPEGLLPLLEEVDEENGLNRRAVRRLRGLATLLRSMAAARTAAEALDLLLGEEDVEAQLRAWLRSPVEQEAAIAAFHALHSLLRGLAAAPAEAGPVLAGLDPRAGWEDQDCVWASTIHKAKGMEWPVVLLPGLREGHCPAAQVGSVPGTEEDPDGVSQSPWMDQERRIFYVGITRAAQRVCLHVPPGEPSRFLEELSGARSRPPAGRSWTRSEEAALACAWREQATIGKLAARMGRTRRAIAARLVRLGLVNSREEARRRG